MLLIIYYQKLIGLLIRNKRSRKEVKQNMVFFFWSLW